MAKKKQVVGQKFKIMTSFDPLPLEQTIGFNGMIKNDLNYYNEYIFLIISFINIFFAC